MHWSLLVIYLAYFLVEMGGGLVGKSMLSENSSQGPILSLNVPLIPPGKNQLIAPTGMKAYLYAGLSFVPRAIQGYITHRIINTNLLLLQLHASIHFSLGSLYRDWKRLPD